MDQSLKILDAVEDRYSVEFERTERPCGGTYYMKTGKEWPDDAFDTCKESDAILLGAVGMPDAILPDGNLAGSNVIFGLRFGLDLYANVRPVKLYPNVKQKISMEFKRVWDKVDMVIVRENTEGAYTPIRGTMRRMGVEEMAVDNRVITRKGSQRVIRFAYELAMKRNGNPTDGTKRLTCVDKSNVLDGCRLFRAVFDEIGKDYPDIERDYAYVDAFTQWLIRSPEFYDVAVTPNLFGDIVTDLAAVLQGGMGMAAGGNIGDIHAMFEPIHGSAPKHAGKDKVNPMAMILATQMMLEWLGERRGDQKLIDASHDVEKAVVDVLQEGKVLTYDLGGSSKCSEVGDEIKDKLKNI
jgi:3-isopropylmalate dehydrogenase